jgi:predicted metal-dependent hydrolase
MVDYLRHFVMKKSKNRTSFAMGAYDGKLAVFGPSYMTREMAIEVITSNLDIAEKIISKIRSQLRKYEEGDLLHYLGKQYPIKFSERIYFDNGFYIYNGSPENKEKCIEAIYKFLAKNYLYPRVLELAKEMHVEVRKINVTSAKGRWGSCSSSGSVSFSWRLIKYRKELVDFVIYHELSHLYVMNHSKDFYDVLAEYCPNYIELDFELTNTILD